MGNRFCRARDAVAVGFGATVEQGFDGGPGRSEKVAVAILFERFFALPVAVGGAHVRGVKVAPQLEVVAAREGANLWGRLVELVEKRADRVGRKRQADDSDQHV